jgi:signal peptide peptidase SppA
MRDFPFIAATLFGTPHMVDPRKLDAMVSTIAPHLFHGVPIKAFDDEPLDLGDGNGLWCMIEGSGIAYLRIVGTLVRRGSWLDSLCGMISYDAINRAIDEIGSVKFLRGLFIEIDSPGGEAGGCFDCVDHIQEMAERRSIPVWAHANENAASAAYAIATAADEIWTTRTGNIGSIGVVAAHIDVSEADKKAGVKWTYIFEGETKVDGNPHEPLSDPAHEAIAADVKHLYDMFVEVVSQNRGMTAQQIRDTKAKTYFGDLAVESGLADEVGTIQEALNAFAASVDEVSIEPSQTATTTGLTSCLSVPLLIASTLPPQAHQPQPTTSKMTRPKLIPTLKQARKT